MVDKHNLPEAIYLKPVPQDSTMTMGWSFVIPNALLNASTGAGLPTPPAA